MRIGLFAFHMETGAGYKIVSQCRFPQFPHVSLFTTFSNSVRFLSGETFQEHEKCGLQEIEFIQVPDPWMSVQKNTSYKEMFKIGLVVVNYAGFCVISNLFHWLENVNKF